LWIKDRKPKLTKHQAREALKRVAAGETLRAIALSYNVDHSTISRLKARYAAEVRSSSCNAFCVSGGRRMSLPTIKSTTFGTKKCRPNCRNNSAS
jgi:hypothetical protein